MRNRYKLVVEAIDLTIACGRTSSTARCHESLWQFAAHLASPNRAPFPREFVGSICSQGLKFLVHTSSILRFYIPLLASPLITRTQNICLKLSTSTTAHHLSPILIPRLYPPDYPFSTLPHVTLPPPRNLTRPEPPQPIPPRQFHVLPQFKIHVVPPLCTSTPYISSSAPPALPRTCSSPLSKHRSKVLNTKQMANTMRAVVFKGPKDVVVEQRPVPKILEATDAVVKVSLTALCGRYGCCSGRGMMRY